MLGTRLQQLPQNLLEASGPIQFKKKEKKSQRSKGNVMNCRDADMMEAEATPPSPLPTQALGSTTDHNDVRNLLTMARQLVDQGKPSQALQAKAHKLVMDGIEVKMSGDGRNRGQNEGRLSLYLLGLGPSGEWQLLPQQFVGNKSNRCLLSWTGKVVCCMT
ncbi:hypothetical protein OROGR_021172 [Orobanche gracilis]